MIMRKGDVVISLTGNKQILAAAKPAVEDFIDRIPAASPKETKLADVWSKSSLLPHENEGFSIPSQVNYVVKGARVFEPGERVKGSYVVANRLLSTGYLWDTVRVSGGAYDGAATFDMRSGVATFTSYRDPNLVDTLSIYDDAADELAEEIEDIDDDQLLEAIIGTIGDLDFPLGPDAKGYASMMQYLIGRTTEDRQRLRDEILATSRDDLREFAHKLKAVKDHGSTVVFGPQAALDAANEVLPEVARLKIEPAIYIDSL
jgi:Zn-dependent M16 (insulinase) family peptidase